MVGNGMCMAGNTSVVYFGFIHVLHASWKFLAISLRLFEMIAELFCLLPVFAAGFDILSGKFNIPMA
jgi:hypothetical protein